MSHTMKLWERVMEDILRTEVSTCEHQYGFMPKKEYFRAGQRELDCVFIDLEKVYEPGEELWYCMRTSGVAEKYVRVGLDIYESCKTMVRCAIGVTVQGGGGTASRISSELLLVCCGDGQIDR